MTTAMILVLAELSDEREQIISKEQHARSWRLCLETLKLISTRNNTAEDFIASLQMMRHPEKSRSLCMLRICLVMYSINMRKRALTFLSNIAPTRNASNTTSQPSNQRSVNLGNSTELNSLSRERNGNISESTVDGFQFPTANAYLSAEAILFNMSGVEPWQLDQNFYGPAFPIDLFQDINQQMSVPQFL